MVDEALGGLSRPMESGQGRDPSAVFDEVVAGAQDMATVADQIMLGIRGEAWVAVELPVALHHRASGRPDGVRDGEMFVELETGGSGALVEGTLRLRQVTTTSSGLRIDVCGLEERVSAAKAAELLLPWPDVAEAVEAVTGRLEDESLAGAMGAAEGGSGGGRGDGPAGSSWRGSLLRLWERRAGFVEWEEAGDGVADWLAGPLTAWYVWGDAHDKVRAEGLGRQERDALAGAAGGDREPSDAAGPAEDGWAARLAATEPGAGLGL